MAKRWEIRRVSTFGEISMKFDEEMARPIGIVLFGADCDFKDDVKREVLYSVPFLDHAPSTVDLVNAIQNYSIIAVVLDSDESAMHELRHELVKVMRNAGAKTVVGIYAKAKKTPIPFGKAMISAAQGKQINKKIDAIEQSNPIADGLDYLIVAEED